MLDVALTALLAPLLAGVSLVAGDRWGSRAGGVVSAFPAIVGPVLLIDLLVYDAAFVAEAAAGTLLGLLTLSAFVAVYGRLAERAGWRSAALAGWGAAALAGAPLSGVDAGPLLAAAAAILSLGAAALLLPAIEGSPARVQPSGVRGVALTMLACGVLVLALAGAASAFGPTAGGVLAALPILASVLAVATHRRHGAEQSVLLLRGMVLGMAGFVAFCLLVALLVEEIAPWAAFGVATVAAVTVQLAGARSGERSGVRVLSVPS